ncbi:MAG: DUF1385 domain-containing protein, partial [Clostridia bacterium]|nr:DUF1385 domain-containing protein [Clostridia bacterium]MBQ4342103.1 DUF1385 domain-containing protein [Clostridia bacterium]
MKKKTENTAPAVRRCSVGGQAVMEGVMMKSDVGIAMAVRRPDGSIVKSYRKFVSKAQKGTFWGLPVVRGVVAFVESLKTGMDTTTKSAELLGEGFEEEPSKFEKWLADKLHVDIMNVVTAVAAVLGVALAVGLFMFLPQLIASLIFGKASGGADSFYVWRSLLEGLLRVGIYVGYLFAVSGIKDIRRVFMYHGAEHKTIACYEAGVDELTPENAKKYRRLHPRCGTNYLFLVMAISILVLTAIDIIMHSLGFPPEGMSRVLRFVIRFGVRIVALPLIAGVSYEVLRAAAKTDNWLTKIIRAPGMALQLITTREPELDMLEVAIYSFYLAMGEKNPLEEKKLREEAERRAREEAEKQANAASGAQAESVQGEEAPGAEAENEA